MTLKSMTGFGRGEVVLPGSTWTVEVRCVNNRYLDVKIKLPRGHVALEDGIRQKINNVFQRGRIEICLEKSGDLAELQEVKVKLALAAGYKNALQAIADEFSLPLTITPQLLASYPEVLSREQKDEDVEKEWPIVEKAITAALQACDTMRKQEGQVLADDLSTRLRSFTLLVDAIEKNIPQMIEQRRTVLNERLGKLLGNIQLDPMRLAQEVAILADKSDVTEEIVRLRCHINQFTLFLREEGGVGRKLDFLIQEFLREVNTLASKINDAMLAHLTVDLKSELEKMREQVQNIE